MADTSPTPGTAVRDPFLRSPGATIHVPDGLPAAEALERTTHLAIVAHPDDLEFLAFHGIAACYESEERWFTGVVLTDGVGGPSLSPDSDNGQARLALAATRAAEQRAAADLGRYSAVIQLAQSSASIRATPVVPQVREDLLLTLRHCAAEVFYSHNPADRHDTHVSSLVLAMAALRELPANMRPRAAWGVECWRDLDWLTGPSRVALPVDDHPQLARELVEVFASQVDAGKRYDRAVLARRRAHATFADSHATDGPADLSLAMDLLPILADGGPTLAELSIAAIDALRNDVVDRIRRAQGRP